MVADDPPQPVARTFADVWALASDVPGWLTAAQAQRLWDEAAALGPAARVVEIGSHQGRSTVVLAAAVEHQPGAEVVAIDPFVGGAMFGGQPTRARFEANLERLGVAGRVRLLARKSQDVRPTWTAPIDLLYIDGKHDYWTCSDDLRWSLRLAAGRTLLVHDAFSSVGVTLALLAHVWWSGSIAYEGATAPSRASPPDVPRRPTDSGSSAELPWWVRNVCIIAAAPAAVARRGSGVGSRGRRRSLLTAPPRRQDRWRAMATHRAAASPQVKSARGGRTVTVVVVAVEASPTANARGPAAAR